MPSAPSGAERRRDDVVAAVGGGSSTATAWSTVCVEDRRVVVREEVGQHAVGERRDARRESAAAPRGSRSRRPWRARAAFARPRPLEASIEREVSSTKSACASVRTVARRRRAQRRLARGEPEQRADTATSAGRRAGAGWRGGGGARPRSSRARRSRRARERDGRERERAARARPALRTGSGRRSSRARSVALSGLAAAGALVALRVAAARARSSPPREPVREQRVQQPSRLNFASSLLGSSCTAAWKSATLRSTGAGPLGPFCCESEKARIPSRFSACESREAVGPWASASASPRARRAPATPSSRCRRRSRPRRPRRSSARHCGRRAAPGGRGSARRGGRAARRGAPGGARRRLRERACRRARDGRPPVAQVGREQEREDARATSSTKASPSRSRLHAVHLHWRARSAAGPRGARSAASSAATAIASTTSRVGKLACGGCGGRRMRRRGQSSRG